MKKKSVIICLLVCLLFSAAFTACAKSGDISTDAVKITQSTSAVEISIEQSDWADFPGSKNLTSEVYDASLLLQTIKAKAAELKDPLRPELLFIPNILRSFSVPISIKLREDAEQGSILELYCLQKLTSSDTALRYISFHLSLGAVRQEQLNESFAFLKEAGFNEYVFGDRVFHLALAEKENGFYLFNLAYTYGAPMLGFGFVRGYFQKPNESDSLVAEKIMKDFVCYPLEEVVN
ncbi:MAG: hypothetical protein LBC83_03335 [Oscillospiraceae bacterium]|jgi:hypothetical protein|nr:hypothetical protein [Oscillospiraceae bacterium]